HHHPEERKAATPARGYDFHDRAGNRGRRSTHHPALAALSPGRRARGPELTTVAGPAPASARRPGGGLSGRPHQGREAAGEGATGAFCAGEPTAVVVPPGEAVAGRGVRRRPATAPGVVFHGPPGRPVSCKSARTP